jgi:hypothetical protein
MRAPGHLRTANIVGLVLAVTAVLAGCAPVTNGPGRYTVDTCPAKHAIPTPGGLPGADSKLVPFVPTIVILCHYSGLASSNIVGTLEFTGSAARALAHRFNTAVTPRQAGTLNCPMDSGASVVAYFSSRRDHIIVLVATDGCQVADNGTQQEAWVADTGLGHYVAGYFKN